MFASWPISLGFLALTATSAIATGSFPPITGPPGLCGPDPADASCSAVIEACVNAIASAPNRNDPYSIEACVAAASCYPANPDAWLSNLFCRFFQFQNNGTAHIPRVPDSIVNKMLVNGKISSQSYAKWYTGVVTAANPAAVPLIDPAFIRMSFDIIQAWTGFCSQDIPPGNFVDWFQWFSTVKGPATTCNSLTNCPITNYPYVMDLTVTCAKDNNAISNPFSIKSCVAAALNWQDGMDSFIAAVTCRYNFNFGTNNDPPASNNLPALSFDLPVSNPPPYTQQNFIDFTYGSLSAIGSNFVRYPSIIDWVTHRWDIIVAWTNFCSTNTVPQNNLSDFLKYSHLPLTSTSCGGGTSCAPESNPSCAQLFSVCIQTSTILTDAYADPNCVLAATCYDGGPKVFGNAMSCAKRTFGRDADPEFWPRLTQAVFNTIGNSQTGIVSQQNFIDAYYGALSKVESPLWPNVDYVIGRWTITKDWAGYPDGNIPFKNFSDWLAFGCTVCGSPLPTNL